MLNDIVELLETTEKLKASDLHISVSIPPTVRIHGELVQVNDEIVTEEDAFKMVQSMVSDNVWDQLSKHGEADMAYSTPSGLRFRVNIYRQRGFYGIAARRISSIIPTLDELGLPNVLYTLMEKKKGLILITGPTGSGKSTTLAAMIDYVNRLKKYHIITLEDPIEYLHKNNRSIIEQREIGRDSQSFAGALRASLRQDPDVILIGEMRDIETVEIALTAAETGHLVLSTLHTVSAPKTIDRILGIFPPHQQEMIRTQLSGVIEGVIAQMLIPTSDGKGRVAACEIMTATPAIRNLIREGKTHLIANTIQTSASYGMQTMENYISSLVSKGIITQEKAKEFL